MSSVAAPAAPMCPPPTLCNLSTLYPPFVKIATTKVLLPSTSPEVGPFRTFQLSTHSFAAPITVRSSQCPAGDATSRLHPASRSATGRFRNTNALCTPPPAVATQRRIERLGPRGPLPLSGSAACHPRRHLHRRSRASPRHRPVVASQGWRV